MQLPPKTDDAIIMIDGLLDYLKRCTSILSEKQIAGWERIKCDLRRLQEIDKRHDGTW